jgi:hypothetical protein
VPFIVCVVLSAVFRLIVALFCVLCLIVVPLPPGKYPFAVKINNNNHKIILTDEIIVDTNQRMLATVQFRLSCLTHIPVI